MDDVFERFRVPLILVLGGLLLIGGSVLFFNKDRLGSTSKVEIQNLGTDEENVIKDVIVEIVGGVVKPGVYTLPSGSRIQDVLIMGGGLSQDADRQWVDKTINQAAKIIDGQKIYIPQLNELSTKNGGVNQTASSQVLAKKSTLVNINTGSLSELDTLPGIGPVYAQTITEQRPYSNTEELLTKGVLKKYVYDKIKDLITVY